LGRDKDATVVIRLNVEKERKTYQVCDCVRERGGEEREREGERGRERGRDREREDLRKIMMMMMHVNETKLAFVVQVG
jgi:hypothetical protein